MEEFADFTRVGVADLKATAKRLPHRRRGYRALLPLSGCPNAERVADHAVTTACEMWRNQATRRA